MAQHYGESAFGRCIVAAFLQQIIEKCKSEKSEIINSINSSGKLEENSEKALTELIVELKKNFN